MSATYTPNDLARAARVYAAEQVEWLASALYAAPIVLTHELPVPAAIDHYGRIYLNPDWLARLQGNPLPQVGFLLVHEVWHWLREHKLRAEEINAQPQLWNIACDLEINDYVPPGLQMPDFGKGPAGATPQQYGLPAGRLAEWYYRELQEREQTQQQHAQGNQNDPGAQGGGGSGKEGKRDSSSDRRNKGGARGKGKQEQQGSRSDGGTDGDAPVENNSDPRNKGGARGKGKQKQQGSRSDGGTDGDAPVENNFWDEGSGVHGKPRPWELPADSPDAHSLSDFDRQSLREEVARRILEAQKTRGDMPAGWTRWAEEVVKPRVNWRERLKRIVRGAINEGFGRRLDYSYRRPHRRAEIYKPFLMPALQGEYRPRMAVVVDTSGSIGDRELTQAMAEVRAVLEQLRVRITIIPCDAVPYEAVQVLSRRDWELARGKMKGGGGTDMRKGIEAAQRLTPPPDAIIVLTDGYTPFPEKPPTRQEPTIIWGVWRYGDNTPRKPPCPPWRAQEIVEIPIG